MSIEVYISVSTANKFTYDEDVKQVNQKHTSPNEVEKVYGKKLVGFQYQDMYALGEYIYFASANTHRKSNMENDYSQVSLFRIKFNGEGMTELVKDTAFKTGEGSAITLQKGSDDNYYFLIAEPAKESTFTIKSLKVGDSIGELKTIVEDAKSYVLPDENSTTKTIIYTVDAKKEQTTTAVKYIDFASEEGDTIDNGEPGSETKLLDRVGDNVFYAYTMDSATEIYQISATSNNGYAPNQTKFFYSATSIKNVYKAGAGFVFQTESGALMYSELNTTKDATLLAKGEDYSDILFVEEDYVYISNSSSIKRVSTIDQEIETIVEVGEMISGQCGYADGYIYFYAQLGQLELDENEEEENEETTDEKYYMYRTDLTGNLELIGKTVA